eukprot:3843289-Amphidinium_carterae.1
MGGWRGRTRAFVRGSTLTTSFVSSLSESFDTFDALIGTSFQVQRGSFTNCQFSPPAHPTSPPLPCRNPKAVQLHTFMHHQKPI